MIAQSGIYFAPGVCGRTAEANSEITMSSRRPQSVLPLLPLARLPLALLAWGAIGAIGNSAQEATDKPLYLVARPELRNPFFQSRD